MITPRDLNCKAELVPNLAETSRFLKIMAGSEPVTFQTFDDSDQKRRRLAQIIHGELTPTIYQKLKELNGDGAGIYLTVNQTDLKGRTAENVVAVRSHFVDLDGAPLEPVKNSSPAPHVIVESSPDRFYAYWIVSDCPLEQFGSVQSALAAKFNGGNVKDLSRVMRLPGFYHRKTEGGKLKNPGPDGNPFMTRILEVHEAPPYTVQQLIDGLGLQVEENDKPHSKAPRRDAGDLELVLNGVPEGEREDKINRAVWHWLAKGLSATGIAVLVKEAARNCTPSFSEEVALEKLDRALAKFKERGEQVRLTDMGNAERLASLHGEQIRHNSSLGWLIYDGRRWVADDLAQLQGMAKETARSLWAEVANETDDARRSLLAKFALRSQGAARIEAMVALLPSEPGISLPPETFDSNKWLLNVLNGTIDLRTGNLRPHDPDDYVTKLAPIEFNPEAQCPRWDRCVMEIMNADEALASFLRRFLGYSLTGAPNEDAWALCWGKGANGKTTLFSALMEILGDYAKTTNSTTFMDTRESTPTNDLAALRGARLVVSSEPKGRRFDSEKLKMFTGREIITCRFLNKEFFQYKPEGTLFIFTNQRPPVSDPTDGFWRRIHMIPFERQFLGTDRDKHLDEKLLAEGPGILSWLVKGCLEWQKNGLQAPTQVTDATAEYRSESDILGDFLVSCCEIGPECSIPVADLYDTYRRFCTDNSVRRPFSRQEFNEDIRSRPAIDRQRLGGKRTHTWVGVGLKIPDADGANVVRRDFGKSCHTCANEEGCPKTRERRDTTSCTNYSSLQVTA